VEEQTQELVEEKTPRISKGTNTRTQATERTLHYNEEQNQEK